MDIKQLEKEIINALSINAIVDWESSETSPNEEFEYLKKFVKKLFREINNEEKI
tara:strand:+ start:383 stop:544 length:162 start_codon:yes stop_codon:yes gene_type:complete